MSESENLPSPLHKIFVGPGGLRAGWGLVLFAVLFTIMELLATMLSYRLSHPAPPKVIGISLASALKGDSISVLVTFCVTWFMAKIERRRIAIFGFSAARALPLFLSGLLAGVGCLSVLVFSLWKSGFFIFDSRLLFGADLIRYGSLWLITFVLVALFEESLTRGYLLFTLTRGFTGIYASLFNAKQSKALGFWSSAIALSLLFALGHGANPGESPIGLLSAGLAGLVFCLSLWRTGSLWWAIGFHASWDWAQSFLYGTADSGAVVQNHFLATHPLGKPILSGGATGPEGSVFMFGILLLISLLILFTLPRPKVAPPMHYSKGVAQC